MKSCFFIVALLFTLIYSCGKPDKQDPETNSGVFIVKEYYSTGILKAEISAVAGLRQGLTRNYNQQGRLISEVNYVNNIREGIARNFYVNSGKLNSSLEYKNGIKDGNEIWYYESGKDYRVTPYVQGVISGIQKVYYENGQLMAEIPYKEGFPGAGLKEYKEDGTLISNYPKLLIQQKDYLTEANKVLLHIMLSDGYEEVRFYKGPLTDGKYLNKDLLLLATQKGTTQIDFNIPPGTTLNQSVILTAHYKTPNGNPHIISRTYNLQVVNKD
jgi:antitoxin component YwqK of YwqJK toxin-antitoxin module